MADRHDFGAASSGGASQPFLFDVTNTGLGPTGAPTATLTGPNAADFFVGGGTWTSVITLNPGDRCTLLAGVFPTTSGHLSASQNLTGAATGSVSAALTASGGP